VIPFAVAFLAIAAACATSAGVGYTAGRAAAIRGPRRVGRWALSSYRGALDALTAAYKARRDL